MMRRLQPSHFLLLNALLSASFEFGALDACEHLHHLQMNYVQGHGVSISCQTTTRPLQSLTVKLRRIDPVKVILQYSDSSPASEQQRWTVRNKDGNVTLHLEDIRSSDQGLYDCEVYKDSDCLQQTQFNLTVRKCKILNSVYAKPNSSVYLPCSEDPQQNRIDGVTWKVIAGHQPIEINKYHRTYKPTDSTEKLPDALYLRVTTQRNGSLLIIGASHIDQLWYRCIVNEKTCFDVRLVMNNVFSMKLSTTAFFKVITDVQSEGDADSSALNLTAVVTASIVSLCVTSLITCLILAFKKQNHKLNSQTELNSWTSVQYYGVSGVDVNIQKLLRDDQMRLIQYTCESL